MDIWGQNLLSIHMNARIIKQKCVTASYKIQISNKKKQKTKQIKNPVKISRLSKKNFINSHIYCPCPYFVRFNLIDEWILLDWQVNLLLSEKRRGFFKLYYLSTQLITFHPLTPKIWLLSLPSNCCTFPSKLATGKRSQMTTITSTW